MSDAQKLMAELIGFHRYDMSDVRVHRCICGADIGRADDALDNHRAAEVDAALGGLTTEWAVTVGDEVEVCSWETARYCATRYPDTMTAQSRWVSGWTPEAVEQ